MLNSLRLRNFKLHEDTKIDAARVTVFIGPNNNGKSSIFQALLLLRQTANRPGTSVLTQPAFRPDPSQHQPYLFPRDTIVDLGEFSDVVRHGGPELAERSEGICFISLKTNKSRSFASLRMTSSEAFFRASLWGIPIILVGWKDLRKLL